MPEDEVKEYLQKVIVNPETLDTHDIFDLANNDPLVEHKPLKNINSIDMQSIFSGELDAYQGLFLLNQDIKLNEHIFDKIWNQSDIHICCDGAIQRLYKFTKHKMSRDMSLEYIPDFLVGDFDSLDVEIKEFYLKHGTVVIKQETQMSSDLQKSISIFKLSFLDVLKDYIDSSKENFGIQIYDGIHKLDSKHDKDFEKLCQTKDFRVIAFSGLGGRVDQCIQNLSQLYHTWLNYDLALNKQPKMIFVNEVDMVFKVPKNGFYITWPKEWKLLKDTPVLLNSGILPVGEPNHLVYTLGYKWDVRDFNLSMINGFVSSSNRFSCATGCYTHADKDVIVNMEMNYKNLSTLLKKERN